jgi:hypothetical protein
MSNSAVCWQCGASLAELTLPLSRFDVCRQCRAELHVCKLCKFYDTAVAKHCREPIAEEVRDKQRANYCDYFMMREDAYQPHDKSAEDQARAQLDALFGKPTSQATDEQAALAALKDLFSSKKI